MVVGFDGSRPARRALDQAAQLLDNREGSLEVVYVAHLPVGAILSPEALTEVQESFDEQTGTLAQEVRSQLSGQDHVWHFQRRDGAVAAQLIAVATDLHDRYGDQTEIVIVVGGAEHRYHHLAGSVASSVIRADRFRIMVVP